MWYLSSEPYGLCEGGGLLGKVLSIAHVHVGKRLPWSV